MNYYDILNSVGLLVWWKVWSCQPKKLVNVYIW